MRGRFLNQKLGKRMSRKGALAKARLAVERPRPRRGAPAPAGPKSK
jgi:hypothetical protein